MKKKAELLKTIAEELRTHMDAANLGIPLFRNMEFTLEELRVLVEALESLRWANLRVHPADYIKHGHTHFTSLGIFYKDAEQALRIGKEAGLETIGVIELKDNEQ